MKVKIDTPLLSVDRYMLLRHTLQQTLSTHLNFVAGGWIEYDSATPEAVWVLHQTEGKVIKLFYLSTILPLLRAQLCTDEFLTFRFQTILALILPEGTSQPLSFSVLLKNEIWCSTISQTRRIRFLPTLISSKRILYFSVTENRLNCNKSLAGFLIDIYCHATKTMH